jgi:adenylate cyclase
MSYATDSASSYSVNGQADMAILMADLSGYTAMTEIHGPRSAFHIVNRYMQLVDKAIYGSSRFLERVGDQVVIVSPNADDLAMTAIRLLEYGSAESNFLPIHAGLHFGKIIEQGGSFYGSAMNITARIAAKAKDGSILCSVEFQEKISPAAGVNFVIKEKVKLKNLLHPVSVVELLPLGNYSTPGKAIDPVCLMSVEKTTAFSLMHNKAVYHFCSDECVRVFQNNPQAILNRE